MFITLSHVKLYEILYKKNRFIKNYNIHIYIYIYNIYNDRKLSSWSFFCKIILEMFFTDLTVSVFSLDSFKTSKTGKSGL